MHFELQLKSANEQLANGVIENAAVQFQKILDSVDANNGEALYGLGVVAAMQSKRDQAKDYFLKALQSPSSDSATKVWSHIFLGPDGRSGTQPERGDRTLPGCDSVGRQQQKRSSCRPERPEGAFQPEE